MTETIVVTTRLTHGGVSPKLREPAIRGTETLVEVRGKAPTAGAFPGFTYHGGPVIAFPLVYTSFWGNQWLTDPAHLERAGRLTQFHADLLQSGFMNVLYQYGVASTGCFIQASFVHNLPATLSDVGIHSTIQSCIDAGALPEPTGNTALVIYLDDTMAVDDPPLGIVMCEPTSDTAFGYHNFFTTTAGHPFYYAVIPGLTDACLTESCPGGDSGCSLSHSEAQEQRQTQVASHEFAEMTTDPELNAWFDPGAGENGDICNGESDVITVGANMWTVQRIYSKYDDVNSNGTVFCLAQAPSPEPRLSPGPAARPSIVNRAERISSVERLFPLPAWRFDARSKNALLEEERVRAYTRRLFFPVRPEHVAGDLPAFLRRAADILEKE